MKTTVNYNDLDSELESLLDKFQLNKNHVIVCGDFNMDPMKHNESRGSQAFIDIMINAGLHPVI